MSWEAGEQNRQVKEGINELIKSKEGFSKTLIKYFLI